MSSSQSSFDGAKWSDGYEVPGEVKSAPCFENGRTAWWRLGAPGRSAQLRTVGADRESRQIRRALDNDASRTGPRPGGASLPLSRSKNSLAAS